MDFPVFSVLCVCIVLCLCHSDSQCTVNMYNVFVFSFPDLSLEVDNYCLSVMNHGDSSGVVLLTCIWLSAPDQMQPTCTLCKYFVTI